MFQSQSQNVSAKLALCVDELLQSMIELEVQKNYDWNELKNVVMHTMHEVFLFRGHSYFFRMFDILITKLISAGVMQHLVKNHYFQKFRFEKFNESAKVLTIEDLLFGFNIWFGCCCVSSLAFIIEQTKRLRKKPRKLKFGKIHPMAFKNDEIAAIKPKLPSELNKMFKIQNQVNRNLKIDKSSIKIKTLQPDTCEDELELSENLEINKEDRSH